MSEPVLAEVLSSTIGRCGPGNCSSFSTTLTGVEVPFFFDRRRPVKAGQ